MCLLLPDLQYTLASEAYEEYRLLYGGSGVRVNIKQLDSPHYAGLGPKKTAHPVIEPFSA